jgi:indole-3-glycerol phosphate synthase/phosphoribosylanthranilate isomerase
MNILDRIVAYKKDEVSALHQQHDIEKLKAEIKPSPISLYETIREKRQRGDYFIITEFKRKSPSEGWINQDLKVDEQVTGYQKKGASAVSVLTDTPSFGGGYTDLEVASKALKGSGLLVLQKDFIIDPIQIYLARKHGANMILLIASILSAKEMGELKTVAESLNMGVLAEVHSIEEFEKIASLKFPVVGVNNRNLGNFKTAINCCNYIVRNIDFDGFMIAESGIASELDLRITQQNASGFLIGTSLMRNAKSLDFKSLTNKKYFFKACGIRTRELIELETADLVGINFSPISKRRIDEGKLRSWLDEGSKMPANAVAVFKENARKEVHEVVTNYGFHYVQLYADDFAPDFIAQIKQKVILAISIQSEKDLELAEQYAPFIDLFILDGAKPGSGELIESTIPKDFPYPFLLAGGMNSTNLNRLQQYDNCIGVDMASGVETTGEIDDSKITAVKKGLLNLDSEIIA